MSGFRGELRLAALGFAAVVVLAAACDDDETKEYYDTIQDVSGDAPGDAVGEVPTGDVPAEDVPVEDVPPGDVPVEDVPIEELPPADAPVEDVPVEDLPPVDVPVEDVPPEDVPVEDVPPVDVPPDVPPATFDLSFSGSGFAPHNGQTLGVAIVSLADGSVIATDSVTVADGAFSFEWLGLLDEGASYFVDYYADFDGSGACDAPPTDHVWRESIDVVAADVDLAVTHNTNFAPEACDSF